MLSLLTEYNENELYKCDSLPSSYSVSAEHNCLLENRITNVCLSEGDSGSVPHLFFRIAESESALPRVTLATYRQLMQILIRHSAGTCYH